MLSVAYIDFIFIFKLLYVSIDFVHVQNTLLLPDDVRWISDEILFFFFFLNIESKSRWNFSWFYSYLNYI